MRLSYGTPTTTFLPPAIPNPNFPLLLSSDFSPTCYSILNHRSHRFATLSSLSISAFGARKKKQNDIVDAEFSVDEAEGDDNDGQEWEREFRKGVGDETDYDRDPELAEILGSCFEDHPESPISCTVEERIRKKRDKIVHTKTGSDKPMKVIFNKFDFSNSYIWFEFYNAPLPNHVSLICNIIRSWHIVGRLGGCNSMNMQLSQAPLENKWLSYDAIAGANVTPTTFYNIGDVEIQDNLGRIWVDIGTSEPLLLDILINALVNINTDYVGIKQLVFGGKEFENWKENLTSEDSGYSVHTI